MYKIIGGATLHCYHLSLLSGHLWSFRYLDHVKNVDDKRHNTYIALQEATAATVALYVTG